MDKPLDVVSQEHYYSAVSGFTKLFSSIVHSTVWREEMHVKVVWITMLALANRNGDVLASLPGLADAARVPLDQTEDALRRLSAPDPYSRTKEYEGRRIVEVDGGWRILNYLKYREIRDAEERRIQTRLAVRRHRSKEKAKTLTVSEGKPGKAQAEAEAEAEAEAVKRGASTSGKHLSTKSTSGQSWTSQAVDIWRQYGGEPAVGPLVSALKRVRESVGDDERLLYGLGKWLSAGNGKYGPAVFARDWRQWVPGAKDGIPKLQDLELAEWEARAADRS